VPGRRLILLLVLLLLTLSVLSATRDISRRGPAGSRAGDPATTHGTTTPATTATPAPASPPAPVRDETSPVDGSLPSGRPVRARLGQRVLLEVKSDRAEIVAIDRLGLRAPVGPGTYGVLDFIAADRGRFPVTLGIEGKRIGEVVVEG